jgi:PAS domain S-box-containing protein
MNPAVLSSEIERSKCVLKISRAIIESVTAAGPADLRGRLQILAGILAELPDLRGTAIVSFDDEGSILTSGACRFPLREGASELEILSDLQQCIAPRLQQQDWIPVEPSVICRETDGKILALPVQEAIKTVGLVLVKVDAAINEAEGSLLVIAGAGPFLASALRSAIHHEAWTRIEQLQHLTRETLTRQPWDFRSMVQALSQLFAADAVTMLLNEQGELRLSASTDPHLGAEETVLYRPGEGLTGYVFETGRALRLTNTKDRAQVHRATGLDREKARFPERNPEGSPIVHFLGVPMRFGAQIVGVLRMARREGVARFTREDEKALQFFADLLGAALAPARDLLLYQSILESSTEGIYVSRQERDTEGRGFARIIMASPGGERLLGRPRIEIEGLGAEEIYAPDEHQKIRDNLALARRMARGQGHAEHGPILSKLHRHDGSLVPVTISYRVLTNQLVRPPTLYTIGLARDTSEVELQAEEHRRLLELLDAMKIAYFREDVAGITNASTAADSEITGYSFEELQTTPRSVLYSNPATRARLLKRVRASQGHLSRVLIQMRRKNGELFWSEGDLRIVKDSRGREIGYEELYRDVTDRIRLQGFVNAETNRALTDSELFNTLVRDAEFQIDYLSSLSHQLLTPLGSLIETLRNFERGEISQKALQQRLPYVIGQAVVCTRLVRNLSYMDKILRGEPFQKDRVSLSRLSIETKMDFLHLLTERRLDLHIDDASLFVVQGHSEMLRQVLVNLTDNAIKYSLPETSVQIRGRRQSGDFALEVSNQGLPLSGEDREKIFQRGYRTRAARAWVPHGTGLGLWLVRKIVEAHGATIRCLEVVENGKKRVLFRIVFPVASLSPRRNP